MLEINSILHRSALAGSHSTDISFPFPSSYVQTLIPTTPKPDPAGYPSPIYNPPTQSRLPLTLPNRRARERVLVGMAAVQVDEDTGGILLIGAGESDLGTGVSIAAAGDAHLAAAQVELRAVQRARSVQSDLLDAQEVVAAR